MKEVMIVEKDENIVDLRDVSMNKIYALYYGGEILIATRFIADHQNEYWFWNHINRYVDAEEGRHKTCTSLSELIFNGIEEGKKIHEFDFFDDFIDEYHNIKQTDLIIKFNVAHRNREPLSFYGNKVYITEQSRENFGACTTTFKFSNNAELEILE